MTKVYVHPSVDIYYSGFYLLGLEQVFGKENIIYSAKPFDFTPPTPFEIFEVYLLFIIDRDGVQTKYALDLYDMHNIKQNIYEWCDIYGQINVRYREFPAAIYPKVVPLCPSFGVCYWSLFETPYRVISDLTMLHYHVQPNCLRPIKRAIKQLRRLPYDCYLYSKEGDVRDNYVFMLSTLWHNSEVAGIGKEVNEARVNFMNACRGIPNLQFEGGLVPTKRSKSVAHTFQNYLTSGQPLLQWLKKTKESMCVFNTPAYWNCHGWKLGEYLALGKCIISTPLSNDLPAPLVHGQHIHFVENTPSAMREALLYIVQHPTYRKQLERGAKAYWEQYGTPMASMRRLGII